MFMRAGLTEIEFQAVVNEFAYRDFVRLFFLKERLEAAIGAGDITAEESADFVAELEDRHRSSTFFANVIGYSIVGTKPREREACAASGDGAVECP